jgi:hypothetical protein
MCPIWYPKTLEAGPRMDLGSCTYAMTNSKKMGRGKG